MTQSLKEEPSLQELSGQVMMDRAGYCIGMLGQVGTQSDVFRSTIQCVGKLLVGPCYEDELGGRAGWRSRYIHNVVAVHSVRGLLRAEFDLTRKQQF